MLSANAADLEKALRDKGVDIDNLTLDPTLPELRLDQGAFAKWIGMMDDVDTACMKTIETFRNHPLIPKDVAISGWVWVWKRAISDEAMAFAFGNCRTMVAGLR